MPDAPKIQDLSPQAVRSGLDAREILLIDVREPDEFAAERIADAINVPLSTFPNALPSADGKRIVFQCAGGKRSAAAVERCGKAGLGHDAHLTGGIAAWKAAGLPTVVGA